MGKGNKLSFEASDTEEDCPYQSTYTAFIDGMTTAKDFLTPELEVSSYKDGIFNILTCSCGSAGCDDFDIKVRHEGELIIWEAARHSIENRVKSVINVSLWSVEKHKWYESHEFALPLIFDRKEYQALVGVIRQDLANHSELESHDKRVRILLKNLETPESLDEFNNFVVEDSE